jgi:hypothetical protein
VYEIRRPIREQLPAGAEVIGRARFFLTNIASRDDNDDVDSFIREGRTTRLTRR